MLIISITTFILIKLKTATADSEWTGRIFPDPNSIKGYSNDDGKYNRTGYQGRIQMGVTNMHCDWGEDPKVFDGDLGPQSYICFDDKSLYHPDPSVHPLLIKDYIPKSFVPWHRCMNESIIYDNIIPTFGDHRALWPKYGEYTFVPKQRWVHSLEHGSLVMLYHPCADQNEINILKNILKGCLYQYVITAFQELNPKKPLVLVAWGVRLEMSKVDPKIIIDFVRNHAYKAPEKVNLDGQYEENLIEAASRKLQGREDNVCPEN